MEKNWKHSIKKAWNFFWHDESITSWALNVVVAFLLIRFIFYPVLGIVLGTSFPIVAVVSESMEHGLHDGKLCQGYFVEFKESFDNYWEACGNWYEGQGISKEQFESFRFKNGFDKGDVIVLWRAHRENLQVGDILVFQANKAQPIIHRVVKVWQENEEYYYQTKGDHNEDSIAGGLEETKISEERIYGKGVLRLPYLGWVKILFVDLVRPLGWDIQR
ncbi:MAG TPA: signal peptidase I [Candidatus Nanoarchaeia archaeon]|nr:signal peptidase I [Candidatus Nanoarchaeia archaeon]